MNIAIVGIDSRGGIQPYLGLALGLQRAGHGVRLVVPSNAVALAEEQHLDARPLNIDIEETLRRAGASVGGRTGGTRAMRAELAAGITRWMAESHAAVAGVDLVMAGAGGLGIARSVAEAVGVPFVEAYLQPIGSATTAFPGVFAPHPPRWLGGPGRWMSHVFTNALLSLPHRPALRRARAEALGLPPEARKRDGAAPVLYGFSPHVVPPPRSWAGRGSSRATGLSRSPRTGRLHRTSPRSSPPVLPQSASVSAACRTTTRRRLPSSWSRRRAEPERAWCCCPAGAVSISLVATMCS
jgi:hypothetical protein